MAWLAAGRAGLEGECGKTHREPHLAGNSSMLGGVLERERDRWFLWLPVLYGGGAGIYFQLGFEPSLTSALVPAAMAFVVWSVLRRGTVVVVLVAAALAVASGFAAAKLRTLWVGAPVLDRTLNLVTVSGWVELVEPRAGRGVRITLRVADMRGV